MIITYRRGVLSAQARLVALNSLCVSAATANEIYVQLALSPASAVCSFSRRR